MFELTKDNFESEVLNATGYILVDFWSDGCEPCKALLPSIVELSEKFGDKLKFCKLNTSQARRLAIKEKVLGLPTIVIYKDGAKVSEVTKEDATKENVQKMIEEILK
ncbi:thioredoxin TrxA [Cetobacterium sp. SF1]|uniref:thioredoxin TrxA n=1 Tax=unclassified Cetobacterium TaxID=2630983 RepID=UPI003CEB5AC4